MADARLERKIVTILFADFAGFTLFLTKREAEVIPGPGNSAFSALPAGYDFASGHGFVDAQAAVAATPQP